MEYMEYCWVTDEHGYLPCAFRGYDADGKAIIRLPDPYDPGEIELHVPVAEVRGLQPDPVVIVMEVKM